VRALFGGIELGGTKTLWGVGAAPDRPLAWGRVTTTGPAETLAAAVAGIQANVGDDKLMAIGIGAFGPVVVHPASPRYGVVLNTPKTQWIGADLLTLVRERTCVPVFIDTDVNVAAFGELTAGAAVGLSDVIYLTVGTGIGGGATIDRKIVHAAGHPEMGHMYLPLHPHDVSVSFSGACPYHASCFEGLASGPAIAARFGTPGDALPPEHIAWEVEAHYISRGVSNLVFIYRPEAIILGGGVMHARGLRERIRALLVGLVNSYIDIGDGANYVLEPGLGELSGVVGAIALAASASQGP